MRAYVRSVAATIRRIDNVDHVATSAGDADGVSFALANLLDGVLTSSSQVVQRGAAVTAKVVPAKNIAAVVGSRNTGAVILAVAVDATSQRATAALLCPNE